MKRVIKSERRVDGGCKKYLLKYKLVSNEFSKEEGKGKYYGIIIEQFTWSEIKEEWEFYDKAQVQGFSESLKETMLFFERIVKGDVMPVSLNDIVDDWRSAFCQGNRESA